VAHTHHVIGSLVLTVVSIAAAEVARPVRFLNMLLGVALAASPLVLQADTPTTVLSAWDRVLPGKCTALLPATT
jgi:hypothetical protein